ncbi:MULTISPECIES: cox cluster protein [Haloferax]|uniref:Cox cluster protein n=2 Tax=Haloferax TaxID=2251 RepID=A0A6G1Z531_9EURY|nr:MULTISPECIES: cox cluster protein [Haloferax]KAB1189020.1 cox cluster protein [Haloferax sp. CBA1149]MRW81747.1 cox cluster protein [Haloferax marinisediminis]
MDEAPGLSDQYRTASPWPVFIALGIPISELGLLFDLFPLSVGGLVLFGGSIAGILRESGYVKSTMKSLVVLSAIMFAFGGWLVFTDVALATRGYAVIVAGFLLLVGGGVFELFVRDQRPTI